MALSADHPAEYFAAKGYETIVAYEDMILASLITITPLFFVQTRI
jgi:hypothetical protein